MATPRVKRRCPLQAGIRFTRLMSAQMTAMRVSAKIAVSGVFPNMKCVITAPTNRVTMFARRLATEEEEERARLDDPWTS